MQWIIKYLTSSIGKKQIMGCTGAFLALFIFGHMCGNFQLLNFDQAAAQASYNAYTEFLTGFNPLHFPIKMIYLVELVLVAAFALHIFLAVTLKIENKKARGGIDYEVNARKGKKTFATFTMIWSGLFILGFLVQHLMMLKFGEHYLYVNAEGEIVRDMWLTTIQMFANPAWAAFYVVSSRPWALLTRSGPRLLISPVSLTALSLPSVSVSPPLQPSTSLTSRVPRPSSKSPAASSRSTNR